MKKQLIFTLFSIVFSSNLIAACISEEMKKQAMDMEAYAPPEVWKVVEKTDVPAKLKAAASSSEQWKMVEQIGLKLSKKLNNELRTETDKRVFIAETEKLLTPEKGRSIGVWQMLLMQSALRCIKRGENP